MGKELHSAFIALSKIPYLFKKQPHLLYHGVTCKSIINEENGIYYGPLSTTTDINIARDFAGKYGMIIIIKPNENNSIYKSLDISLISDFPAESEVLLLNHNINIQNYVYTVDYDNNYSYYKQLYVT